MSFIRLFEILELLKPLFSHLDVGDIVNKLNEVHRSYHNKQHIVELFDKLPTTENPTKDYYKQLCLIVFHDIIYDPKRSDNEEASAEYFKEASKHMIKHRDIIDWVYDGILATKTHEENTDPLLNEFLEWDMDILNSDEDRLIEYENQIRSEYSFVPSSQYKKSRLKFLEENLEKYPNLQILIDYLNN